jgi:hypothetical protein
MIITCLKALMLLSLLFMPPVSTAAAENSAMLSFLPAGGCAEGWIMEEKPALYTVDTLFDHINGEAELYFPYGFDTLATARYVKKATSGSPFVADVYRMGSFLDAFGIYSNYRKAESPACNVGADCFLSSSQLLFYQDRYFVRLQATDTPTPGQEVFLACGRAISAKLPPDKNRPAELDILNVQGVAPNTERYIAQSVLGYPFFRRGMTADAVVGGEHTQVFVVIEDSAAAARKAFDEYSASLKASGTIIASMESGGRPALVASDPLYRGVYIELSGRYLVGAIRLKDPTTAKPLVAELRKRTEALRS